MKTTVFIATSVDGFIARENGGIDWLTGEEITKSGEDYGYRKFMDSVDAIVMGRNTFELVLTFDSWSYGEKPVIVLSSRNVDIPKEISNTVESMSAPPQEVVQRLTDRGFNHLYIDGGKTIQGFLREGLIHRLIITEIPVLIGTGIPLFGPLTHDIKLRLVEAQQFQNGLIQNTYEVLGNVT